MSWFSKELAQPTESQCPAANLHRKSFVARARCQCKEGASVDGQDALLQGTSAWFLPLPTKSSHARAGANVLRSLESSLDHQRVALSKQNSLSKSSEILSIQSLKLELKTITPVTSQLLLHMFILISIQQSNNFANVILTWPLQCKKKTTLRSKQPHLRYNKWI